MAKKLSAWKTKGMNKDISVSAFNPEFAFENMNLRLATNEGNTLMSWVNEKGTAPIEFTCLTNPWYNIVSPKETPNFVTEIKGTPIGTAVINHQLVLFTTGAKDCIYCFKYSDEGKTMLTGKLLFEGLLGFDLTCPLETLVSYEAEDIQKVYWTDGKNQPRLINISVSNKEILRWHDLMEEEHAFTLFDFITELKLNETVRVEKLLGASGMFAPGVIQYAFTYYKKNGQESNIFYTTPLYYISHKDRGASPEDKVDNAFRITIQYIDEKFDYIRIYSIHRTSIDAAPIVKRIQDIDISHIGWYISEIKHLPYDATQKAAQIAGFRATEFSYTDTGMSGDSVDPTELLYKGGRTISAYTLEQKDNTLFLGNFKQEKAPIAALRFLENSVKTSVLLKETTRVFKPVDVSSGSYQYQNQLTSVAVVNDNATHRTVPCAGFKHGDYYRCGIQFQYKTGEWSPVVYVPDWPNANKRDFLIRDNRPSYNPSTGFVTVPTIQGTIDSIATTTLLNAGYRKARPVVVFPSMQDRVSVCQGVACPTLYTDNKRNEQGLSAQSSWFFRTKMDSSYPSDKPGTVAPYMGDFNSYLEYTRKNIELPDVFNPENIRRVEIQGDYKDENKFKVDTSIVTFHSPDIDFDTKVSVLDLSSMGMTWVGNTWITKTLSDIDIQTETPTASNGGSGFVHKSFKQDGPYGIVSGLFYDDYLLDDVDDTIRAYDDQRRACKWLVYLWNRNGSLNNDFNRPADKGVRSAVLKQKIISNLRYTSDNEWFDGLGIYVNPGSLQLFSSDQTTLLKWKIRMKVDDVETDVDRIYQGNIDTMILPDSSEGMYFALRNTSPYHLEGDIGAMNRGELEENLIKNDLWSTGEYMLDQWGGNTGWKLDSTATPFTSEDWWKTFNRDETEGKEYGVRRWNPENKSHWDYAGNHIGDDFPAGLNLQKDPVRMKYKSSPHIVFETDGSSGLWSENAVLPILELRNNPSQNTIFGGKSTDALKENIWLPCGEPVVLGFDGRGGKTAGGETVVYYDYGDTYYQRWDCLKTYAFTPEDVNQVVEIGSFMLETRVNIDGRYDRNRGELSNLYMSPRNFNLFNPIYSQQDNFFSYRVINEDAYRNMEFPNQVTWSLTKTSGADVDLWTNLNLASVLELDGDKGKVNKLIRFNDQMICFQDTGISQVLYNENVQVSSTEGVPIEIANSGKVQGKRYLSNTTGCSNKWSMVQSPIGIYFMDSNEKSIYLFNGQLQNISGLYGFNAWSKQNIPTEGLVWNPMFPDMANRTAFTAYNDRVNQDILFINGDTALAYSEKLGAFTSFYDYGNTPYLCSLDDTGIWIKAGVFSDEYDGLNIITDLISLPADYMFKVNDAVVVNSVLYKCTKNTSAPPFDFVFDTKDNKPVYSISHNQTIYMIDNPNLNAGWVEEGDYYKTGLWKHQAGDYCNFFGIQKPYWMTLIGNPEPQTDKIFTNLEFRACVEGDGEMEEIPVAQGSGYQFGKFTPSLPFDYLETWDEYQHGIAYLSNRNGHSAMLHHTLDNQGSLKRKFRIWRCDIPRDNHPIDYYGESRMGVSRFKTRPMDRMRNPWLYLKLMKADNTSDKTEIHDILMTYFN